MIRSIRYITLLVLLQFVTGISVLYAQSITSASGIVRDSVSGEPLSYVSVMFENSTIGAMTDDDGAFSLQNDKGLTRLVVSSLGYDNKVGAKEQRPQRAPPAYLVRDCRGSRQA